MPDQACRLAVAQLTGSYSAAQAHQDHTTVSLQGCLGAFFARENVTWECPAETAAKRRQLSVSAPASTSLDSAQHASSPRTPPPQEFLKRRRCTCPPFVLLLTKMMCFLTALRCHLMHTTELQRGLQCATVALPPTCFVCAPVHADCVILRTSGLRFHVFHNAI